MPSSSFDISGLSDVSLASIGFGDVGQASGANSRPAARPSTSFGRPAAGRVQPIAQQRSASSIKSGSIDLSGSIEIDHSDLPQPVLVGGSGRPASRGGTPPPMAGRSPAPQESASSIEISGSDLSGSIEMGDSREMQPAPAAARAPPVRPTTSGRPPPAPGRPVAPVRGQQPSRRPAAPPFGRRSSSGGSSLSISGLSLSSGELNADLDISGTGGGGGGEKGITAEVLSLDGPKKTKTHITRAGRDGTLIRESTHTIAMSEPESLLSMSAGDLGSGSLDIEHSEEQQAPRAAAARPQGRVQGPQVPPQQTRQLQQQQLAVESVAANSTSIEYDADILASGGGSASIEYDASTSYSTSYKSRPAVMAAVGPGRAPVARQPVAAARYDVSKTPSISGSSSSSSTTSSRAASSIGKDDSASELGGGTSRSGGSGVPQRGAAAHPHSHLQPGTWQPDPMARTTGSVRLSRPQSIGGLTAEPVFASGSSRSGGVTPSMSGHGGGGGSDSEGSRGGGDGRAGVHLLDASALQAATSGGVDMSYDTYDSRGGVRRVRNGRRAVDSGGGGGSASSSSSGGSSYGVDGERLRGIEDLAASEESPPLPPPLPPPPPPRFPQQTRSATPDISMSYSEDHVGDEIDDSYDRVPDDSYDLRRAAPRPPPQQRTGWLDAGGGGSGSVRRSRTGSSGDSARGSGRSRPQQRHSDTDTDSSLAETRPAESGSRGGGAASRYTAGGARSSNSSGSGAPVPLSESVVSEPLSSLHDEQHVSDVSGSPRGGGAATAAAAMSASVPAGGRSRSGVSGGGSSGGRRSRSGSSGGGGVGGAHDLLADLEMTREGSSSGSSSSSSSGGENIMTVDQLLAQSTSGMSSRGSGDGGDDDNKPYNEYDEYSVQESVAAESLAPSARTLSRANSAGRGLGASGGGSASGLLLRRLGSGQQREFSFSGNVTPDGAAAGAAAGAMGTPRNVLRRGNADGGSSDGGEGSSLQSSSGRRGGKRGSAATPSAAATVPRPAAVAASPPRAVPDPRVAVVSAAGDSGSHYGSVGDEDEALMAAAVRSPGDEADSWRGRQLHHSDAQSSEHSSPSLSREGQPVRLKQQPYQQPYRQPPPQGADPDSPSGTLDASTSRLSQSGALSGVAPVAPAWTTLSPTAKPPGAAGQRGSDREWGSRDGDGGGGGRGGAMAAAASDPNQFSMSRDSDLSEEFIPSQAMQRGLPEQPIFRPLMPNIPTPRASIGAMPTVPAFTARGVASASVSPDPRVAGAGSPPSSPLRPPPPPPPPPLSPAVAAAAAPPPPRTAFAATQTDVYSNVVDLDPIPRPGTVKLRTVAMQWGTLNEAATQVAFDPAAERLVPDTSAGVYDSETLPPALRRQLQAYQAQQQQMYGPFSKRGGGGGGILQAGADSLLLGDGGVSPLSGIGPGFGILSLAFHSVKTAALLEQLERSLSSAATAAGMAPPPAYPPHLAAMLPPGAAAPYQHHPYGGWPAPPPHGALHTPQSPGQAAAAAYAAAVAAAGAAAAGAQPSASTSAPGAAPPSPLPVGENGSGTLRSPTGPARESSAHWPTLTTVTTSGTIAGTGGVVGSGASRPTSPLPLTSPPSRLRAAGPPLPAAQASIRSSLGAPLRESSSNFSAAVDAAASAAAAANRAASSTWRNSRLSGSGAMAGPKRSPSPILARSASYARSASSARRAAGGGSDRSSGEYTADFEDVVEESCVGGSGDVDDLATTAVVEEEDDDIIDEVEEEVVEESIPEEDEVGGSSGRGSGGGSGDGSAHYSEDFETDSVPAHSRSVSRTASFMHRSSLIGSTSRGKMNPLMSGNSFSGRSLLRRGSVVVSTLAPIAGSETVSRDDEEEGSPPQGSRVLARVGSIIKSSSGFKRTASISITMADDPLLPNQMARIIPKTGGAATSSGAAAGLAAQASSRRLSTDDGRGQHQHPQAPSSAAAAGAEAVQPDAAAAAADYHHQQQQQQLPPPGAYSPYYPYPPHPYGSPYGMAPYPPYPPYVAPAPATSVASVLQYLPPPIPYLYPPYPGLATATPQAPLPGAAAPAPQAAAAATTATYSSAAAAARPHSAMAGHHPQPQPHLPHHVKFADVVASGAGAAAAAVGQHPGPAAGKVPGPGVAGTADGTGTGPAAAVASATGGGPLPGMPPQPQQQHPASFQQPYPYVAGGFPAGGVAGQPPISGPFPGYAGYGLAGTGPMYTAQSTLQRFGAVLSSGTFPGLDPSTVRTIRADLVKTAAAVSSQVGYEDIVAEQGAADEYRAQLARVRARLAAARASIPSVVPSQEKVVMLRAAPGGPEAETPGQAIAAAADPNVRRVVSVTMAPGSYRYTTLEDTRRLIDATRPYSVVGVS